MEQVKNSTPFFTFFDGKNTIFDIFSNFFDRKRHLSEYNTTRLGIERIVMRFDNYFEKILKEGFPI